MSKFLLNLTFKIPKHNPKFQNMQKHYYKCSKISFRLFDGGACSSNFLPTQAPKLNLTQPMQHSTLVYTLQIIHKETVCICSLYVNHSKPLWVSTMLKLMENPKVKVVMQQKTTVIDTAPPIMIIVYSIDVSSCYVKTPIKAISHQIEKVRIEQQQQQLDVTFFLLQPNLLCV